MEQNPPSNPGHFISGLCVRERSVLFYLSHFHFRTHTNSNIILSHTSQLAWDIKDKTSGCGIF